MTESDSTVLLGMIRRTLRAVRSRRNTVALLRGTLGSLAAGAGLLAIALVAEQIGSFPAGVRTVLFWGVIASSGVGMLVSAGPPLLRRTGLLRDESDLETASRVGRAYPLVRDRLVNLLQLYEERHRAVPYYSTELIDAAFEDLRGDIETLEVSRVIRYAPLAGMLKRLGGVLAVLALLLVLFPDAAERLVRYTHEYATVPTLRLVVHPGDTSAVKGDFVDITVRTLGAAPASLTFASRPLGQQEFEERLLQPVEPRMFTVRLRSLKTTTEYYVFTSDARSDTFSIHVADRPIVRALQLQLHYPRYSGLGTRRLEDDVGDVTALRGTTVALRLLTSTPVSGASLVFSDSVRLRLGVDGTAVAGEFRLLRDLTYRIHLLDSAGLSNADPITYTLTAVSDAYPTVSIVVPGTSLDVTEAAFLDLLLKISDDFGFTRLRLAHKLVQSRYGKAAAEFTYDDIPLPASAGAGVLVPYRWPLSGLSLVPEDVVQYFVEVFDNDAVSGPKSSASEIFSLRLPSLDEVFADVERAHDARLDDLQSSLREAHEARKDLEQLKQDLTKERQKLEWQTQRSAENLLKRYDALHERLGAVQEQLERMTAEMQKRQLLSSETLEKYQELQRVMEELNSPELAEALKRMQLALQQLSPEAMRQALQSMEFSEETFRKSLERTLALLKRVQIEQRMDELVRRAGEMTRAQEMVRDQTMTSAGDDAARRKELSRRQAGIEEERAGIEKTVDDLAAKMEEFLAEMPVADLQKAKHAIGQSGLDRDLRRAVEQLERGESDQAAGSQMAALEKMKEFTQRMEETRKALQRTQTQQVVNELSGVLRDLLELSQREEALKRQSTTVDQNSLTLRENAQRQMDVMRDLMSVTSRLGSLSQKTFSVSPEMGKSIGDALRSMRESTQLLDQRSGAAAAERQTSAMASLNQAAQQVQEALNALRQGGGGGMAGLLQRLQRLTGMQQGINDGTRGLTERQAAEMARLAGEQGIVRKSLEQLAREASARGEGSRLLGDLNRIAQEMREVQSDLARQNVNPETVQRQERILSRLLDSQRSLQERDFEKQRRAEVGRTPARTRPGPLDLSTREARDRLRQDLLRALEGGYAREYELLIRKYFEALEQ